MTPSPSHWSLDPVERARFLDGEGTLAERAAREADLAADSAARARVDRDAAFLDVVHRARAAREEMPAGLEARVREALAADREAGPRERAPAPVLVHPRARTYGLAAAAAAAGLALWLGLSRPPVSHAQDEATLAADAARGARSGRLPGPAGATCEHAVASPYRFPLVANGELRIAGCRPTEDAEGVVSVVGGMDDPQAARGLVSVRADAPAPPPGRAPDVGVLTLEDMVVFDVSLGGVRYTLAAPRESVERLGRCAACHSTSREGQANPHRFYARHP